MNHFEARLIASDGFITKRRFQSTRNGKVFFNGEKNVMLEIQTVSLWYES